MDVNVGYAINRGVVSALAFLFWDMLINLSDEVDHIWRARNTWVKWTYMFVRHFPILMLAAQMVLDTGVKIGEQFTSSQCVGWLILQAFTALSTVLVVDAILVVRIYVIYSRNRPLLFILLSAFAIEITSMTVCAALAIPKTTTTVSCLVSDTPVVYAGAWLASMGMQSILFVCTCYRFYTNVDRRLGTRSILHTIIRDGFWAFASVFLVNLTNLLLFRLNQDVVSGICFVWAIVAFSLVGSHLQLNVLKELTRSGAMVSGVFTTTGLDFSSGETTGSAHFSTIPYPAEEIPLEIISRSTR